MSTKPLMSRRAEANDRPRVLIRPPVPADRRAFVALMRASRRFHRRWVRPPTTPSQYDAWLERLQGDRHKAFLVCRREDGAVLGVININEIIRGIAQSAFLGWYVAAPHRRRGYMTEGLRLVLRHAFQRMRLHRLEANIQPDNAFSLALARRCGFRREGFSPGYLKIAGRWRDHERWAILASEWAILARSWRR